MSIMCLSCEVSLKLLSIYHDKYTFDCCPEMPEPVERIKEITPLLGTFPVVAKQFHSINEEMYSATYSTSGFGYSETTYLRRIIGRITETEFYDNQFTKEHFEYVKAELSHIPLELIKYSSPKISNFLLSILEHCKKNNWENDVLNWEKVIKRFNDRGSSDLKGYELLVSTEPHRIAGMSAFGHFTSCQDWIRKDLEQEYHGYTHMAWANLKDPTCAIACIRRTDDTDDKDMLSRVLVRVMPLENGHVVVYVGRLYAISPYNQYMKDSLDEWAKSLPANYHVLRLYDDLSSYNPEGKNAYGEIVRGTSWVDFNLNEDLFVEAHEFGQCNECNGTGYIMDEPECENCNGSGTVTLYDSHDNEYECDCQECNGTGHLDEEETECPECNGKGHWIGDLEEVLPYNDYTGWIDFENDYIRYKVPNYVLHYTERVNSDETIAI